MIPIPETFRLVDRTYTVEEMDTDAADMLRAHGTHNMDQARVLIRLDSENQELIMGTFCHELVHALLEAVRRDDLSSDENLVDGLGAVLHQFLQTAEGDLQDETNT